MRQRALRRYPPPKASSGADQRLARCRRPQAEACHQSPGGCLVQIGVRGIGAADALPTKGIYFDPGKGDPADLYLYFAAYDPKEDAGAVVCEFRLRHEL